MGDEGVKMISEVLKTNTTLTMLSLKCIYNLSLKQDMHSSFIKIDNNIGDAGVSKISESLKSNKSLTELNLNRE